MYSRKPLNPALPFDFRAVSPPYRAAFEELASTADFRVIDTFKEQVLFAYDFVNEHPSCGGHVPKIEIARFLGLQHGAMVSQALKRADTGYKFRGRVPVLMDADFAAIEQWIREALNRSTPLTALEIVARLATERGKETTVDALKKAVRRRKLAKVVPAKPDDKRR